MGTGIVLVLIGILAILAGISMDTTKQAATCYEVDGVYGRTGVWRRHTMTRLARYLQPQ